MVTYIEIGDKPKVDYIKDGSAYVLITGKTLSLAANVNMRAGDMAPNNAAVTWSVFGGSGSNAVTINPKTGVLSFVKNAPFSSGATVQIQASAADGSGVNSNIVTVNLYPATSKLLIIYSNAAAKTVTLNIGGTAQLSTDVTPTSSGATYEGLLYTSSKPTVAAVDADSGKVTAIAAGTAVITVAAKDGSGKKATCNIKVVV